MVSTYILGIIAQLLTIIMWFLPTLKANYFSSATTFVEIPEFDITLFSYSEQLPVVTNYLNLAFLLLGIVSMIYMAIPLIKNTVMKPYNMLFPTVFNLIYLVLFFVRYLNAVNTYPLYHISNTAVSCIYFFSIFFAFAMSLSIVIYNPRLKKQNSVNA